MFLLVAFLVSVTVADQSLASDLEWIQVAEDGSGFELAESHDPFIPWGFNYDHNRDGELLEDYWDDQWTEVESDFREMKELGANVVRIHLQFGKFMLSPTQPNQHAFQKLACLVMLAEETELYLNITGLGCYHKQDVPAWYNELSEEDRWSAQAEFWESVARTCSTSPAIFCYDLMNEPVVPGGDRRRDNWLGPAFAGKHFVQFIALDRNQRDRSVIAREWIRHLRAAIRRQDERHLITVGLVPWSLDRPGLTSGFDPQQVADDLDFISVHFYPEQGKVDDAVKTLKGFASTPKPVVIEEMFPLKCNARELEEFIDHSQPHASGWFGFYWGQTPEELRAGTATAEALTLSWLQLFERKAGSIKNQSQATPE